LLKALRNPSSQQLNNSFLSPCDLRCWPCYFMHSISLPHTGKDREKPSDRMLPFPHPAKILSQTLSRLDRPIGGNWTTTTSDGLWDSTAICDWQQSGSLIANADGQLWPSYCHSAISIRAQHATLLIIFNRYLGADL
jgi:hypothetical protein